MLHCTLRTLHSTLHFLHSTLRTLHFTLYTPHFTLYTLHFALYTLHFTLVTPHFTLYTPHFTLKTLHFTLYTPHLLSTLFRIPQSTVHWYGNRGNMYIDCSKNLFHKSVLRDCIRVRRLHLVLVVQQKPISNSPGGSTCIAMIP